MKGNMYILFLRIHLNYIYTYTYTHYYIIYMHYLWWLFTCCNCYLTLTNVCVFLPFLLSLTHLGWYHSVRELYKPNFRSDFFRMDFASSPKVNNNNILILWILGSIVYQAKQMILTLTNKVPSRPSILWVPVPGMFGRPHNITIMVLGCQHYISNRHQMLYSILICCFIVDQVISPLHNI